MGSVDTSARWVRDIIAEALETGPEPGTRTPMADVIAQALAREGHSNATKALCNHYRDRAFRAEQAIREHRDASIFVPESEAMLGRVRPWDERLWSVLTEGVE